MNGENFQMIALGRPVAHAALILAACAVPLSVSAKDPNWRFDGTVYANVPTLQVESRDGTKTQIDREDVASDLDFVFQARLRALRNFWSASVDIYYFDIEDDDSNPIGPGQTLDRIGIQGVLVTPNVGYRVIGTDNDMASHLDTIVGARYLWLDVETNIDFDGPIPPGGSTTSDAFSNWDAVIGVQGRYFLTDRWYIPYFADIGKGQSDSTGQIAGGIAYRFNRFSASAGWRYIRYNVGSDSEIKELDANGPFVAATFFFD